MGTLLDQQAELADRCRTIHGFHVLEGDPKTISSGSIVVGQPGIEYDLTFGRGAGRNTVSWPVAVYVARTSERTANERALEVMATSGTRSVRAAINGTATSCDFFRVLRARVDADVVVGQQSYLAVLFEVEAVGV